MDIAGPGPTGASRHRIGFALATATVLLVALLLRVLAARGEPWLDEIWTFNLLTLVTSPVDIFWRLTHDNNHHLNSLYLYLLGEDAGTLARRALAIASGVAGVAMAGLIGLRRGRVEALITMGLMALAYPMVHYASEARGYAPMMLFVLLGFYALEGYLEQRRLRYSWLLALAVGLGFLSHMTIVFACLALGFWGTAVIIWDASTTRQALAEFFRCFGPAFLLGGVVLAMMFAGVLVNGFVIGGVRIIAIGDHFTPFVAGTATLLQLELGLPFPVDPVISLVVFLVLGSWIVAALARRGDRRWSFYVIVLVCVPLVMLAVRIPYGAYPRYFLFSGVFLLVLLGQALAVLWKGGAPGKVVLGALMMLFAAGQGMLLGDFLKFGRGKHKEALDYIASQSGAEPVLLGSDKDFLSQTMINYYEPRRTDGGSFVFVEDFESAAVNPDWLLMVRSDCPGAIPLEVCDLLRPDRRNFGAEPILRHKPFHGGEEVIYHLDRQFFHWGLAGWNWSLYRKPPE